MTTTMTRVNVMAVVAAMVMMVCVAQANARDYSVGASITIPLNMQNIMERGTLTISGEMRSSVTINQMIDASVTTINNTTDNSRTTVRNTTTTKVTVNQNTTNKVTNHNNNHTHNNNHVSVRAIANSVTVNK